MNSIYNTSNQNIIEQEIERKFNEVLDKLPLKELKTQKNELDYFNYNIYDLYKNTLKTIIDIINDIVELIDNRKYINSNYYYKSLLDIFFNEKRLFYIGIIFIILSIIMYFIDGATI